MSVLVFFYNNIIDNPDLRSVLLCHVHFHKFPYPRIFGIGQEGSLVNVFLGERYDLTGLVCVLGYYHIIVFIEPF